MSPVQPERRRPVTRAKNVNQRPGQIILESQQKRRNTDEMAKVRAQEHIDKTLTERHIRVTLKNVASVQDQQQVEDDRAKLPIVAPSLRRHETLILSPCVVSNDAMETGSMDKSDLGTAEGEGCAQIIDEWVDDRVEDNISDLDNIKAAEEVEEGEDGRPKKKKKGEGMRAVIDSLRKNPPPGTSVAVENSKLINLVTRAVPAPKGKKPRALAIVTGTQAHTPLASVSHPTNKASAGIITNWADRVADATRSNPTRLPVTPDGGGINAVASASRSASGAKGKARALDRANGGLDPSLDLSNEADILTNPVPEHKIITANHVPLKRKFEHDLASPTSFKKPRASALATVFPPEANDNNLFRGVFIPTYERWVGTQANPWVIPDTVAKVVMQTIWDAIYQDVAWTEGVFERATQRLCEWRNAFKSAADIMFEQFFEYEDNRDDFNDYGSRQGWAQEMLSGLKFVYAEAEDKIGLMRAPFILQVFATHLNSIVGAKDVPGLEVTIIEDDEEGEELCLDVKYPPKGALGLATTAVERTLRLWADGQMSILEPAKKQFSRPTAKVTSKLNPQTGIVSNVAANFSADNWGSVTTSYVESIDNMEKGSLDDIVKLAGQFMSPLKRRQGSASDPNGGSVDIRAYLVDKSADPRM